MAHNDPRNTLVGNFEIEVFGADLDGQQFIEQTQTLSVTRDGGTIALANKLAPDSELIVRNSVTNEETVARVVDLIRNEVFVQVYGIAFIDPLANLWQLEFPEVECKKTAIVECSHCHAVEAALLGEIETDIFESKHTIRRYCDCRNSSTIWKQTDRSVTIRRSAPSDRRGSEPLMTESVVPAPQERRKGKRTAMKVPACIRCNGWEEVVACEDVSRGGFRFKSQKKYQAGLPLETAAPYVNNGVNIFVAARIAYQQRLSADFYRYGVEYVKSIKWPASRSNSLSRK